MMYPDFNIYRPLITGLEANEAPIEELGETERIGSINFGADRIRKPGAQLLTLLR